MMRMQTRVPRAGSRGAGRPTLPASRAWAADGAGTETASGAHDLARIGVSAPASSAPIQRVRTRSLSTGDLGDGAARQQRQRSNSLPPGPLVDDRGPPAPPPSPVMGAHLPVNPRAALPPLALHQALAPLSVSSAPSPAFSSASSSSASASASPSAPLDVAHHPSASVQSLAPLLSALHSPPPQTASALPLTLASNASASASPSALVDVAHDPSASARSPAPSPPPTSALQSPSLALQPPPSSVLPTIPALTLPLASNASALASAPLDVTHVPSSSPRPHVPTQSLVSLQPPSTATIPAQPPDSSASASSPPRRSAVLRPATSSSSSEHASRALVSLVNEDADDRALGPSSSSRRPSSSRERSDPSDLLLDPRRRSSRYGTVQHGAQDAEAEASSPLRDFITANTPGPITGVSGTGEAVTGLLNPPTSHVNPDWANKPYVQALAPHTKAVSMAGGISNMATGVADGVGFLSEAHAMHKKGGWSRFWSGLKANFRNPFKAPQDRSAEEAERRSEAKRLVVNSAQNLGDLGANQVPSAISNIATATGHAAAPVLGTVAAGAGAGINAAVAGRSWWRGLRAWWHERKLNKLDKTTLTPDMAAAAEHHEQQLGKRKRRNVVGAIGATAGAVGGGLLLAGLLGATALTPVGWGLAAAGGLVAAGLGAYKLGRWAYKKYKGIGSERDHHAQKLHEAIENNNPGDTEYDSAVRVLGARGITPDQVRGKEGRAFLKRKAESW
jgi:hypothetical protein